MGSEKHGCPDSAEDPIEVDLVLAGTGGPHNQGFREFFGGTAGGMAGDDLNKASAVIRIPSDELGHLLGLGGDEVETEIHPPHSRLPLRYGAMQAPAGGPLWRVRRAMRQLEKTFDKKTGLSATVAHPV
ncbi:hypothetical protein [Streptomyces sp. NPDC008092]|uniref:hypothetical protein n=1 Tax=Streptomyces sp. NPDC008092 TaxID=3364808 RepID=UPI0036E42A03